MKAEDKEKIEKYAKHKKIFIDTCSLMCPGIDNFFDEISPFLKRYNNKIILTTAVGEELNKHIKDQLNADRRHAAKHAVDLVKKMVKSDCMIIRGAEGDGTFGDNVFLTYFQKFKIKYQLLLITQDRKLTQDVLNINGQGAVESRNNIIVKRIFTDGSLHNVNTSRPEED